MIHETFWAAVRRHIHSGHEFICNYSQATDEKEATARVAKLDKKYNESEAGNELPVVRIGKFEIREVEG